MGLPFLRPMDIDPSGPSDQARQALFLCSSVAPFTPFGPSLSAEGGQLGWLSNKHMQTVRCSWVDGWNIDVNGDRLNWDDGWNVKQTVTRFMRWRLKCQADGDKVYGMTDRKEWGRQVYRVLTSCPEAFMVHDTCRLSIGFYLRSKRRFVFRALLL